MFSSFTRVQVLNSISILVGTLALTTFFGFSFHSQKIYFLGQASGFAPMPLPFRELVSGAENINVAFRGSVWLKGKEVTYSSETVARLFSLHSRPHRAVIPFYTITSYFPVVPEKIKRPVFIYLCRQLHGDKAVFVAMFAQVMYTYSFICK